MRTVILALALISVAGCSSLSGPTETKTFELEPSGGYGGQPVGSCSMRSADEVCRSLGWEGATDYSCGTVHVTGGFFGPFDQDVMYCVTCYRD